MSIPPDSVQSGSGSDDDEADRNVAALIQALSRPFAAVTLRSAPVQPRAVKTVERILAAGRGLGVNLGRPAALQAVAAGAGVTLSAVYRYFSTPEDVVRTLVRLAALRQLARLRTKIAAAKFTSTAELADRMAAAITELIRNDLNEPGVTHRLRAMLIRDYHRIAFEELWTVAGEVRAALRRNGVGGDDPDGQARMALAFGAASGLLNMRVAQTGPLHDEAHVALALRSIFLTALDPAPRENSPLGGASG
jgi:AcrR family transcriptional regulator